MRVRNYKLLSIALSLLLLSAQGFSVQAQVISDKPEELERIRIDEHLGKKIPLDLEFQDESGETVRLASFFNQGKPILLTLVYYECPMLCTFVLNGVNEAVSDLQWPVEEKFQMISVSIDPSETSELAAMKKKNHLEAIGLPEESQAWRFLVGKEKNVKALADAVGFRYYYDERIGEYAHGAAAFVITETGKISRYLYGIQPKSRDLKLALLEASEGKIGSTLEKILLYCYRYDPSRKGYALVAWNVMRIASGGFALMLVIFGAVLWRREKKHHGIDDGPVDKQMGLGSR